MSPSLPRLARLIAPVALGVATLVLAASPTALAGTVEVRSCGDAPTGGVDNAWQPITDNLAGYEVPTAACPPTSTAIGTDLDHPQILGRSVWTKLMSGVAPTAGDGAQMRLTAPAGTVITAVSLKRDLGKRNDGYALYGKTASGAVLDNSCAIPGGQAVCYVGGSGTAPQTFSGLNTAWIAWGFECGDLGYPSCNTGSSLHQAWAHIYASTVTLTDNQAPTSVTAAGAVTTGGWKSGSVAGTISGSDNLGVQKVRWYADGALVSTSADRACDFSTTVPCADASNVSYSLDTTGLADGTRSIQAAVVDRGE